MVGVSGLIIDGGLGLKIKDRLGLVGDRLDMRVHGGLGFRVGLHGWGFIRMG